MDRTSCRSKVWSIYMVSWSCIEHVWTAAVQWQWLIYIYLHVCSLQHLLQVCASLTQDLLQTQWNVEPLPRWHVLLLALPPLCTSGGTTVPSYQPQHLPPTESLLLSSVMQGGTPVKCPTWLEMTGAHTHWMCKVKMVYIYTYNDTSPRDTSLLSIFLILSHLVLQSFYVSHILCTARISVPCNVVKENYIRALFLQS